ncbi:MAG: SUMF1/EgtB/PvdO family nonheme iron enzyme [Thermoguttaceae bacterium]|nr:SUMF1/EgtB/PvdO family nonheme iron enzyme [Thermoguttaceae bacterium]
MKLYRVLLITLLALTPALAFGQADVRHEESFSGDENGHSQINDRIIEMTPVNVLALPNTKLISSSIQRSDLNSMLTDGTAGVWVGDGRVWVDGTPATIVYRLAKAIPLEQVVVCTSNSDQRANQDFEVVLSNSEGYTLTISSGDKIVGCNSGPYLTSLPVKSNIAFDTVTFRIWNTYPANAGTPAKANSTARDWCSVVELLAVATPENAQALFPTPEAYQAWSKDKVEAAKKAKEEMQARLIDRVSNGLAKRTAALRLTLENLYDSYPDEYESSDYMTRLDAIEKELNKILPGLIAKGGKNVSESEQNTISALTAQFNQLHREATLSNPLLKDFSELLVVKRSYSSPRMGLPCNWESNSSLPKDGFDDAIVRIPVTGESTALDWSKVPVVYKPEKPVFVGDVDLNWDADKILFSSIGENGRWQVFEYNLDGKSAPKELTSEQADVDSYDACYLPDGRIIYTSTAIMAGVPCVYGSSHIATLFLMNGDGTAKRQLAFDQEHSWNPVVLNNGRVLYQRWEYADLPHSNSRQLFQCNPDGTGQLSYYNSNSYWPNSFWYSRPIPGERSMIVSVITGHHDSHRAGELCLFDPALGRNEADGCIQRIPGYGKKVEPIIKDGLVGASWPKFLHPYPLSDKYFLVSCKPTPQSKWGLYLVDVFDNMTLLYEDDNYALLEPLPLVKRDRPNLIQDRVNLSRKDAEVYIADIYNGPGLKDVPRGTVKSLRLFTYHFSYQNMGGLMGIVGVDGPWDIKEVMGTVPVNPDGSARFRIPANTPIAIQPLDESGQSLQLMRSWFTAMPGELLQCNGCHEDLNQAAIPKTSVGFTAKPAEVTPWYGDRRGFAYPREVQPIIDKYCLACHNGADESCKSIDLRGDVYVQNYHSIQPGNGTGYIQRNTHYSIGYYNLQKYVRRSGIESDMHLLEPKEFSADTTELVQLLRAGHHGVRLSDQAWDRILTWIDLNCPYHGTWTEATKNPGVQRQRRIELAQLYGNLDPHDAEAIYKTDIETGAPILPDEQLQEADQKSEPVVEASPENYKPETKVVTLPNGQDLEFVRIPAGIYTINAVETKIDKPFWISAREIRNDQFAAFDPTHDSRVESKHCYQFGIHGYPMNKPNQPVCRVTQQSAQAFCDWLTKQLSAEASTANLTCKLPTQTQWEWAARAGKSTPFFYGTVDSDFSPFANLSDASMHNFATDPYTVDSKYVSRPEFDDWIPADKRFNDGVVLTTTPGSYRPNDWGVYDVHGNVAEWTSSTDAAGRFIVKGGSWYDRPYRAAIHASRSYPAWQRVFDVGFRVILEEK